MSRKNEKKKSGSGLAALFCLGAFVLAAHSHSGLFADSNTGSSSSCLELEKLWRTNGGSSSEAFTAAEVAMAESGGKQYATDYNPNGTVDRGYWQINSVHGSLSTFDRNGNARSAIILSADGTNWSPWTTYQNGSYSGKCLYSIIDVAQGVGN